MESSLLLKGAPGSPYTRKMLAVLRYRRIPYRVVVPESPLLAGLPVAKVDLQPTFYLPDASGQVQAVTDSTPLIRRFEGEHPGRHVRPVDPVLAFLDSLFEDYADEWLTKALFHYRWHFEADRVRAGSIQPRWRRLTAGDAQIAEISAQFIERQVARLRFVGSNPVTAPLIEDSYLRFLGVLEDHLRVHPFVFGARPAACDFALYGQLSQLALFDPTPAALALARAPRVCAWVGLVDDLSGHEPLAGDWLDRDAIAGSVHALLEELGRTYVPVMLANARASRRQEPTSTAEVDGRPWTQNTFPYQAKCVAWLRDEFSALGSDDRLFAGRLLARAGCDALIHAPI